MVVTQQNKKKTLTSMMVTIFIVAMLIISGPAQAVSVMILGLQDKYTQGSSVKFQIEIDINDVDRFVQVHNVSLDVAGPVRKSSTFLLDGTKLSGDGNITITPFLIPKLADYGYGPGFGYDFGYGYGYGNSGYGYGYGYGRGFDFGYGYGYGYGYGGYGYGGGGGKLTYIYNVTINTEYFPIGSYAIVASLNTGNDVKPSFDSAPATFEIKQRPTSIIPAKVTIEPDPLNLASHGEFTAFIELPAPYDVSNISNGTIVSEGAHAISGNAADKKFIAHFRTQDLVNIAPGNAVKFTVKGNLKDGTPFEGNDTIKVISQGAGGPSGRGGRGSTGGGGVVSGEPFDNIEKCGNKQGESNEKYLIAGSPVAYSFTPCEGGIYEIVVIGNENENDVTLRVEHLHGLSKLLTQPAPEKVYYYVNIWSGTKRIKEAIIRFKVENSWLNENNLKGSDIRMLKWKDGKWVQLDTTEKTKDATHTYFEAKTDGFSHFVVAGLKGETPANLPETIKPTATIGGTPKAPAGGVSPPTNLFLIGVITVLIAIAAAVLYFRRK